MARINQLGFTSNGSNPSGICDLSDATIGVQEFDASASYSVGDYCAYNNALYKCTTAKPAGTGWNSSYWESTSIKNELVYYKELTQSQYNALSTAEKNRDDVVYFVTDGVTDALAEDIRYDNTSSELDADDAQEAIDDVVGIVGKPIKFNSSQAYSPGAYCIHNDQIYSCVTAVTAGSEFNANNWIPVDFWTLVRGKVVNMGTISSLPVTKRVSGLPIDFEVDHFHLGTPSAQTSEWTCNTAWDGTNRKTTITISGTISGSTTLKLWFMPYEELTAT